MAEAKNVTFDSIMADLKARKFFPVYYLMGDEPYYIDRIADYIAEHVLQPEERDFNQSVLFGSDVTGAQIADTAPSPLSDDGRISGADSERGSEREADGGAGEVLQVTNALYNPCDVSQKRQGGWQKT